MFKKIVCLLLVVLMAFSIAGCRNSDNDDNEQKNNQSENQGDSKTTGDYKIGIITGTVSQGEEEFQAAQNMVKEYGDKIVTATYPDNFSSETETTIANVVALSSDPEVKAIVFVQAVPGACAAIDKVRETRPDMLFICGVAAEDPATIASKADIVMLCDEITMGTEMPLKAAEMGAKTFIHYSFARHLSYATIAARRELMMEQCEKLGLEFVDVTAPDPTGDAGVSGAQQFILEDVPRQVAKYGKDTAFFSTNCAMQEPLIRSVIQEGAIYPQQCCPSPYHAYPGALGIDVVGHEGDVAYMFNSIKEKLVEAGQEGRMSTWKLPVNMLMVEAGVKYAIEFCEGRTNGAKDDKAFRACINNIAEEKYNGTLTISLYKDEAVGELNNFYMLLCDYYDFSK